LGRIQTLRHYQCFNPCYSGNGFGSEHSNCSTLQTK